MKKLLVLGMLTSVLAISATPARANGSVDAALALGAFAVFNQLVGGVGLFWPGWPYAGVPYSYPTAYYSPYYASPYYAAPHYAPATVYAAPQIAPAPAAAQGQVVYPHGRFVLTGDGVTVAYRWVWVPNPPAGPPPPPPTGK